MTDAVSGPCGSRESRFVIRIPVGQAADSGALQSPGVGAMMLAKAGLRGCTRAMARGLK